MTRAAATNKPDGYDSDDVIEEGSSVEHEAARQARQSARQRQPKSTEKEAHLKKRQVLSKSIHRSIQPTGSLQIYTNHASLEHNYNTRQSAVSSPRPHGTNDSNGTHSTVTGKHHPGAPPPQHDSIMIESDSTYGSGEHVDSEEEDSEDAPAQPEEVEESDPLDTLPFDEARALYYQRVAAYELEAQELAARLEANRLAQAARPPGVPDRGFQTFSGEYVDPNDIVRDQNGDLRVRQSFGGSDSDVWDSETERQFADLYNRDRDLRAEPVDSEPVSDTARFADMAMQAQLPVARDPMLADEPSQVPRQVEPATFSQRPDASACGNSGTLRRCGAGCCRGCRLEFGLAQIDRIPPHPNPEWWALQLERHRAPPAPSTPPALGSPPPPPPPPSPSFWAPQAPAPAPAYYGSDFAIDPTLLDLYGPEMRDRVFEGSESGKY